MEHAMSLSEPAMCLDIALEGGTVPSLRTGSFPLRLAREGEWVRVAAMNGGPGFHDRLAGMGLHVGAELQVLCNPMDGKLIVCLEGTRLFLGGGMAQKIQVVITKGMTE